jgi:hypothetical protein
MSDRTTEDIRLEHAELRRRFHEAYDRLEALLFQEDPIAINFGDNTDEYAPEVGTILPRLRSCRGVLDVRTVVHEEFVRWFSPADAGPPERYSRIAERICEELPEFIGKTG